MKVGDHQVVNRCLDEVLTGTAELVDGFAAHAHLRGELAERHE